MKELSLYHIDQQHQNLLQQIEESDGEITEETMNLLSINETNLQVALVSIGGIVEMLADRREALKKRKEAFDNELKKLAEAERKLKARMGDYMDKFGVRKIETPDCTIKLTHGKSPIVDDVDLLPEEYVRTTVTREPDKVALKKAIANGEVIMGVTIKVSNSVTIK